MSLDEARSSISEIVSAANDFQSSIQSLQSNLLSFADEVIGRANSISTSINESNIVDNSVNAATNIVSSINKAINLGNEALSILSEDANKKIKEIVDDYNNYNDSLPIEKREDRLDYVEISLSGAGGSVSYSGGSSGKSNSGTARINRKSNTDVIGNGDGGNYTYVPPTTDNETETQPQTFDIDYYFELLGSTGVNSADIVNWDEEIKKFLIENELDQYVKKIEFDGNKIKVTLFNDEVYDLENITNKEDFLKEIRDIIEKITTKS